MANPFQKRGLLIGGVVLTLVGWFPKELLSWLQSEILDIPNHPISFTVGALGIALIVIAAREEILDSLGIYSASRLAHKIKDYLHSQENYSLLSTKVHDKSFSLIVEFNGQKFEITKSPDYDNRLVISFSRHSEEKHKSILARISEAEKDQLCEDVILELTRQDFFTVTNVEIENGVFKSTLAAELFIEEGFSEKELMEWLVRAARGSVIVAGVFQRWIRMRQSGSTKETQRIRNASKN